MKSIFDEYKTLNMLLLESIKKNNEEISHEWINNDNYMQITYREYYKDLVQLSYILCSDKYACTDRIGIICENNYQFNVFFVATLLLGKKVFLLDKKWDEKKQKDIIEDYNLLFVVSFTNRNTVSLNFMGNVEEVDIRKCSNPMMADFLSDKKKNCELVLFTSGTSAQPKGVCIDSQAIWHELYNLYIFLNPIWGEDEKVFSILPYSHCFPLVMDLLFPIITGSTVAYGTGIEKVFKEIALFEPTFLTLVPSVFKAFAQKIQITTVHDVCGTMLKSFLVGGASINYSIVDQVLDCNIGVIYGYGMTETAGPCIAWNVDSKLRTIGKAFSEVKVKTVDGELLIKSPTLMTGYYDKKENAVVYEDGWLKTGDLGYIDQDGYIYITGRKKNIIVLENGINISPEAIEKEIRICKGVQTCIVFQNNIFEGQNISINIDGNAEVSEIMDAISCYNYKHDLALNISDIYFFSNAFIFLANGKLDRKATIDFIKKKIVIREIIRILSKYYPESSISEKTDIHDDLCIDSFSFFNIIAEVEGRLAIPILGNRELKQRRTIGSICDYLVELINKYRI